MIAVDTNILARFYCDDPESKRQRPLARRVMIESPAVFVPLTVVLEFEWVMRGLYGRGGRFDPYRRIEFTSPLKTVARGALSVSTTAGSCAAPAALASSPR
jgi:hypothetical protein